jgi:hypothetical protein
VDVEGGESWLCEREERLVERSAEMEVVVARFVRGTRVIRAGREAIGAARRSDSCLSRLTVADDRRTLILLLHPVRGVRLLAKLGSG